jgi:hypothetical protein
VVAGPGDEHAVAIAVGLASLGIEPTRVDLADLPARGLALGVGGRRPPRAWLGAAAGWLDPAACLAGWWRLGREPPVRQDAGEPVRRLSAGEWTSALRGLVRVVPGRWVNDPAREEAAQHKVAQLEVARRVGLDVPRALVTNHLGEARRFIRGCRRGAVLKSLCNLEEGGFTRAVGPRTPWLPDRLATGPAILQERLDGLDLRVTVVGRRLFAATADARAGEDPADVRRGWWKAAEAGGPYRLPPALARALLALTRRLGLAYAAIDLRRRRDGGWAFLEVNPAGQWLHVELAAGLPITAELVALLAGPRHAARARAAPGWKPAP